MVMTTIEIKTADLAEAVSGSWFTLLGCGEPLEGWVKGMNELLADEGIGQPREWFQASGMEVNIFARHGQSQDIDSRDKFQSDLTLLMFPLDGLNVGKLALFRLLSGAQWFDDVIDNMRRQS